MINLIAEVSSKRWIGRWIIAVAIIHIAFTFILSPAAVQQVTSNGFYNTLDSARTAAGVWFFFFGIPLLVLGYLIDWIEKSDSTNLPRLVAWGLTLMTLLGVIIMPVSGFYMMLPALVGLFIKSGYK